MPRQCNDCGRGFDTQTSPERCNCGNPDLEFVSKRDLRQPHPMDLSERNAASAAQVEETSPDVNADGSLGDSRDYDTSVPDSAQYGQRKEKARAWYEIVKVGTGSTLNEFARLGGLAIVLLAVYNMLVAPLYANVQPQFIGYRELGPLAQQGLDVSASILFPADIGLFAIGLVIIYWFAK